MNRWTLGVVMCLAGCAQGEWTLNVLSYNVRYGTAKDGENNWEHRRELLTGVLRKQAPDLFGTQECLDFQAEYIAAQLPEYRWLGIGREKDGQGEMTAIFYRKADFVPVETGHFWLSAQPSVPGSKSWDSSLPRIASWALFHHPGTGRFVRFVNTHFDHKGAQAREESARLLVRKFAEWGESVPIVLTGDFNANAEDSAPWKTLNESGLGDARLSAQKVEGPVTTWCGFETPKADGARIDWIFAPRGWTVLSYQCLDFNQDGRYPSDHLPVTARFAVK